MWILPTALLFGLNHNIYPGSIHLSSQSQTLLRGFLAVISVNIVIAFYICMAMKEPSSDRHAPDSAFLAGAEASMRKSTPAENEELSKDHNKQE
ncbi:hypothetical protein AQUCO_00200367v1 [Aquilegia coerulea]|uniref:Vacuolar ATPase assembly integral membrane protein VMA21 homolog n=1 Tax=Aquilegia coerulea TaxID=218851 RepID=A0A2G5F2T7_AQUCA|nr:hypothetical protein AQUCO_00200367v1 [Aquilegia coerulea]